MTKKNKDKEIWKSVKDFDGYFVSDLGRIKNIRYYKNGTEMPVKYLKPNTGCSVNLSKNNKTCSFKLSRLILTAFVGNPVGDKNLARHLDDDITNNDIENLAWGSYQDNYDDAVRNGTHGKGSPGAKKRGAILKGIKRSKETIEKICNTKALFPERQRFSREHGIDGRFLKEKIMKQGKGKQKGSAFERKIAKELSLWLSNGAEQDLLWRSSLSGGRATIKNKKGEKVPRQVGDLSPISALGETFTEIFSIECKHYRSLNIESLVFSGTGNFVKFWEQACRDAAIGDKCPMLIAKQNNRPAVVALNSGDLLSRFKRVKQPRPFRTKIWLGLSRTIYIFILSDFLEYYTFRKEE